MGSKSLSRLLADYFQNLFEEARLVDLSPLVLKLTWRNGRVGAAGIAKRLDRLFISEQLMEDAIQSRSWVINSRISDHNPICLQLEGYGSSPKYPFKFNHAWMKEKYFQQEVKSSWLFNEQQLEGTAA